MSNFKADTDQDDNLLAKLCNGDQRAFDKLYEKYWQKVYAAAYKRLQDEDGAKDVTQDIFMNLWKNRETQSITNLNGYLMISVRNNVFKWMEKERRTSPIIEAVEQLVAPTTDHADATVIVNEFLKRYHALLDELTPSQKQLFQLRYHDGLSTLEIATQLNISRKTVQNQLGKITAQIRDLLAFIIACYPNF